MDIKDALLLLDTLDDNLWTSEGAPKIDAVSDLVGRKVTRQEIIEAAPKFTKSNPDVSGPNDESPVAEEPSEETPAGTVDIELLEKFAATEPMDGNAFYDFLKTVPTASLLGLKAILDAQMSEVAQARKNLDEREHRLRYATVLTTSRIGNEIPEPTEQESIRDYLDSQHELRMAKKAAVVTLLKGVDISALDPRAAIDRAMARKTKRGTTRPVHPSKV